MIETFLMIQKQAKFTTHVGVRLRSPDMQTPFLDYQPKKMYSNKLSTNYFRHLPCGLALLGLISCLSLASAGC